MMRSERLRAYACSVSSATAAPSTRNLNFRLEPIIQLNIQQILRHCYYELLVGRAKCATRFTFLEPEHHSDFRRVSRRLLRQSDAHVYLPSGLSRCLDGLYSSEKTMACPSA